MMDSENLKTKLANLEAEITEAGALLDSLQGRIDWLEGEAGGLKYLASVGDPDATARLGEIDAELATRRATLATKQAEREGLEAQANQVARDLDRAILVEVEQQYYQAEMDVMNAFVDLLDSQERVQAARVAIDAKQKTCADLANQLRSLGGHCDGFIMPIGGEPRKQAERRLAQLRNLIS